MELFLKVIGWVFSSIPYLVLHPKSAFLFWVVVIFVAMQYGRVGLVEKRLYGVCKNDPMRQTITAVLQGIAGGLIGSLLMVFLGVTVTGNGLLLLLPLALFLMLVSPRLGCYSYAGGLVSLSNLVFGYPQINVPGVMGLVAVLHAVESILISIGGSEGATPLHVRNRDGDSVGAFGVQRFWPVPIVLLAITTEVAQGQYERMPDWWPLFRPPVPYQGMEDLFYVMIPVVGILGYSDLAITLRPERKRRLTGRNLALYSMALLALSVFASRVRVLEWLSAVFGIAGHEAVIFFGSRREMRGKPFFRSPQRGAMVLDVIPGTPASRMDLRGGDIILEIEGEKVDSRKEAERVLSAPGWGFEFLVSRAGGRLHLQGRRRFDDEPWGIVLAPEPDDPVMVEFRKGGMLLSLLRGLKRFRRAS